MGGGDGVVGGGDGVVGGGGVCDFVWLIFCCLGVLISD